MLEMNAAAPRASVRSLGEEIANSVSHGVALLLAAAGVPVLVVAAARHGSAATIVGASMFGATMVVLYLASTLYHALPDTRAKHVCRLIDHAAIFLLIAGTYTPFTLGVLRGPWGWTLLGLVWTLAGVGILMKLLAGPGSPVLSVGLYLLMGWLVVIAAGPLMEHVPMPGLAWLMAGGLSYTAGVVFYSARRVPYAHFVWHLFVIAGSACHYVAVLLYAA
jgi:hemolysin III